MILKNVIIFKKNNINRNIFNKFESSINSNFIIDVFINKLYLLNFRKIFSFLYNVILNYSKYNFEISN